MAEQIEIAEAVDKAARELYALNYSSIGDGTVEMGRERWDTTGGVEGYTKFAYREKVTPLVGAAFEPIARQVWGFTQPDEDYPGFEVTRG